MAGNVDQYSGGIGKTTGYGLIFYDKKRTPQKTVMSLEEKIK